MRCVYTFIFWSADVRKQLGNRFNENALINVSVIVRLCMIVLICVDLVTQAEEKIVSSVVQADATSQVGNTRWETFPSNPCNNQVRAYATEANNKSKHSNANTETDEHYIVIAKRQHVRDTPSQNWMGLWIWLQSTW